jgi:mannan endo-1,4-beta-mannosidase
MTNTKHLKNLVWVWDIQDFNSLSSDAVAYNPGSDYWDIAALDVYNDNTGYSQEKYDIMVAAAAGKPMAIGECQKYLSAQQLAQQPGWAFFMGWSELVFSNNSPAELNSIMHAGNTVTLDQMPGWK